MKFTKALLALALTSAISPAFAVGPSHLGNLSGNSVAIGNSFLAGSSFNDIYTFDILPLSAVAGTAVSIELDIPLFPGQEFSISNFMIQFRDAANNLIASDMPANPTDYTLNLNANLPAGSGYQFVVSGNVTGTLGGSYGGALAAAPVPEADTYAMLLAGLGLVGFMVARRRPVNV